MKNLRASSEHTYDVIIIGAGSAGISARNEVAKLTENYVVIGDDPLGTTCARVGCMPSKVLIEASKIYSQHKKFSTIGVSGGDKLKVDHQKLMDHVRSLRDRFVAGVMKDLEGWREKHLFLGRAQIVGKNILKATSADSKTEYEISGKKIIIATGSSPIIPKEWSSVADKLLTSDNFFELKKIPARLAVIGMGPVGLELAQALANLNIEVFLFGDDASIGGSADPEILASIRMHLKKDLSFVPKNVEDIVAQENGGAFDIVTKDSSHNVDGVLVATGRKPNIAGLGLENLGVLLDKKGLPKSNPKTTRIEQTAFYLAGDVSAHIPLLHEAVDEGRIAGYNSVREKDEEFERRTRLAITYSHPQIAVVGSGFKDLKEQSYVAGVASFENQGRAVAQMENVGLIKVYAEEEKGLLLGAEIFGPSAEHMAHLLAWSVDSKCTVFDLLAKPYYHPVLEEGLRTALRNLGKKLPKRCSDFDLARCADMPAGS